MDESTGATLRQAREQRHFTLQQVSEKTRIRPHYLQALENDDLAAMPSAAQARGFLRIYADFLGLDVSQLIVAGPAVEAGPGTLPSSSLAPADKQGSVPEPKMSRPSLLSTWRERWRRRGGGHAVDRASISTGSVDSPGAESPPVSSATDLDDPKKKGLN